MKSIDKIGIFTRELSRELGNYPIMSMGNLPPAPMKILIAKSALFSACSKKRLQRDATIIDSFTFEVEVIKKVVY